MWFAIVIVCLSVFEFGATCNVGRGKTTCITEDLLQMVMGINTRRDTRIKPAFVASLKQNHFTLKGIDDVVKFDDVKVNRGQGYNPSTGVFTAPRKGMYLFTCMIMSNSSNDVQYGLNKNDALYIKGYSNKSAYATSTISDVLEMKKGDRVFIKHRSSKSQEILGNHSSRFSGYFIQE